jgi:hypothetical protein
VVEVLIRAARDGTITVEIPDHGAGFDVNFSLDTKLQTPAVSRTTRTIDNVEIRRLY